MHFMFHEMLSTYMFFAFLICNHSFPPSWSSACQSRLQDVSILNAETNFSFASRSGFHSSPRNIRRRPHFDIWIQLKWSKMNWANDMELGFYKTSGWWMIDLMLSSITIQVWLFNDKGSWMGMLLSITDNNLWQSMIWFPFHRATKSTVNALHVNMRCCIHCKKRTSQRKIYSRPCCWHASAKLRCPEVLF